MVLEDGRGSSEDLLTVQNASTMAHRCRRTRRSACSFLDISALGVASQCSVVYSTEGGILHRVAV